MSTNEKLELIDVELIDVPVRLWAKSQEHFQDLMREFTLITQSPSATHPLPGRLLKIVDDLILNFSGMVDSQTALLEEADATKTASVNLKFSLPPTAAVGALELNKILDEVDQYCSTGEHLLTLATPPDCVAYRHWYLAQFIDQIAGARPLGWHEWLRLQSNFSDDKARRELLELSVVAAGLGTYEWNVVTRTLSWDTQMRELFGYQADATLSVTDFTSRVHPDDIERVMADWQTSIASCAEFTSEYRIVLPNNRTRWVGTRGHALQGEDGEPARLLGAAWDVTALREPDRMLQQQSEQAVRRANLLNRITEELVSVLDPQEAADRLARLVLPALGDWCLVTLIDDPANVQSESRRGLGHAIGWHVDPTKREILNRFARERLGDLVDDRVVIHVIRSASPYLLMDNAIAELRTMFSGNSLDLLEELEPQSMVVFPLIGRNGPVGMMSLCNGPNRLPFSADDLVTARHVAGRAGLVLENARLYREQRDLAEDLQRSLLTAPAQPEHLQIAVRYTPASDVTQVGGDWYDAFLQDDQTAVVVIGDVVGHDTFAAAVMGQARTLVRGIGVATNAWPAILLEQTDKAMQTLESGATASAVVARFEQTKEELARNETRMVWSNAGHPPPMIIGRIRQCQRYCVRISRHLARSISRRRET